MPTLYSIATNTKVLSRMRKGVSGRVDDAVTKTGFLVEGRAKINAPVDTGALRSSIYTSLAHVDNGTPAQAQALDHNPDAQTVRLPKPENGHTAYVGPSVAYGEPVELGTLRRSGTPFLQPAVRDSEGDFKRLLAEAVRGA